MPGRPRKAIVDEKRIGYYHCYSRCVRRAYLCGADDYTGQNFDHRKQWVEERMEFLATAMAVDLIGHALMDNHLHAILRNRPDLAAKWSAKEVARRWLTVCPGRREQDSAQPPEKPTKEQIEALVQDTKKLRECRQRLSSISWMMKLLKEHLARRANAEDGVGGAFFESRFKSTRLLDLYALIACSMYVDLNPIRAGISQTPETSDRTSVFRRIVARQARLKRRRAGKKSKLAGDLEAAAWLAPVEEDAAPPDGAQAKRGRRASDQGFLPWSLDKYLQIVDWYGRRVRDDKPGAIPSQLAPILERLNVGVEYYLQVVQDFAARFADFAGTPVTLRAHAAQLDQCWLQGVGGSES